MPQAPPVTAVKEKPRSKISSMFSKVFSRKSSKDVTKNTKKSIKERDSSSDIRRSSNELSFAQRPNRSVQNDHF